MMQRVSRMALGLACAALVAACSSTGGEGGGSSTTSTLKNIIFLNQANPPPAPPPAAARVDVICPRVEILPGTSSMQLYAGRGDDPRQLRYQAAILQTARECANLGVEVGIRVGVAGRMIAGPQGGAGSMDLPLRVTLVDENNQPVVSNLTRIRATIPAGQTSAEFAHVEQNIAIPIPSNRMRGYRVIVGFDPQGRDRRR